jgi:hypothetical protein
MIASSFDSTARQGLSGAFSKSGNREIAVRRALDEEQSATGDW